jgi:diguanylate cyclase
MAERLDDKGANWREKYLDALDQQEQLEKQFAAQQELLRRALVRVSVSAEGQDDALDDILSQVRERLRSVAPGDIGQLLARLDEAAISFEQHRDRNALEVLQSLQNTLRPLQQLDLSRGVKKDISKYLAQLPQRSKKVRLYPALLQQLADIQQQAIKELEQPKTGLWQKLLGQTPPPKSPVAATESADELATGKPSIPLSGTGDSDETPALALVTRSSPAAPVSPLDDKGELPRMFVTNVTEVINQFLNGLEQEAPLVKKMRDLVMQAYLSANQAFANYLKNINQELADIYAVIDGSVASGQSLRAASDNLQASMMEEMANLEANAESATDLAQLKDQVKSRLGNIRQALDHFQQSEQQQNQLASQLEALGNKVKLMETEAERNRTVLEKQRHRALHDPLTELPNREYYNERSAYEFQRWQRYGRPLTLAVLDIDHFKKINDTHGHQAGDRVLKVIGRSIAKRLREVDFFCRYGGEEFLALMPETSVAEALPVLEKIRASIAGAAFNYKEEPLSITLSIGLTEFVEGDDIDSAFARADAALYQAKSGGRNCTRTG